ncbi:hypothetical protein SCANM63S_08149 [Streptomyces canarius]
MAEPGAGVGERAGEAVRVGVRGGGQVLQQPGGLGAQGLRCVAGQQPRHDAGRRRRGLLGRFSGGRRGFDDHVGVGAGDAEGGDAGPARAARVGPGAVLGQQTDVAPLPLHVPGGPVDAEAGRQGLGAQGLDHLDDTGDTGGGLGVPEVGLDRAEPQRAVLGVLGAVGGDQRLGLDGVAEGGAGAVRLDHVDLGRRDAGCPQGAADDALLGGAVGGADAVGGAVLVDGGAAQHGEDRPAVAAGVGEPFQQQDAGALAEAGAVGGVREGLAAAVPGQAPVPAELHEGARGGHDGHAPGQRQGAVVLPQRLRGQVQRHQRGGAGRVDGQGRALQAEGVGDAAGDHAAGAEAAEVVVVHDAREHTGVGAAQGGGVDGGPLQRLPGGLQQQPLLRVGDQGLLVVHGEERRVEVGGVVEEGAVPGVAGAGPVQGRVVQVVDVPAAVGGELADGVPAFGHQPPQVLRGGDAAGEAAGHADDGDRLVGGDVPGGGGDGGGEGAGEFAEQVAGESGGGGVVEHKGGGQPEAGGRGEAVAQFDGGQRVEAEFPEGEGAADVLGGAVAEDGRDMALHELGEERFALRLQQPGEPVPQAVGATAGARPGGRAGPPYGHQGAEQRGQALPLCAQGGHVQLHRQHGGVGAAQGGVEEGDALLGLQRGDTAPGDAREVRLVEGAGHAARLRPQAPGQGVGGQSEATAVCREGVEVGVGGGVVGLARRAQRGGGRGEQHERREVKAGGEFVQVPGGVGLGPEDRVDPLRRQGGEHAVGEDAGRVDHGGQRPVGRYGVQHGGERGPVGDVARGARHLGAQGGEFGDEVVGGAAPAHQQQVPHAPFGDQVPGEDPPEGTGGPGEQNGAAAEAGRPTGGGDRVGTPAGVKDRVGTLARAGDHVGMSTAVGGQVGGLAGTGHRIGTLTGARHRLGAVEGRGGIARGPGTAGRAPGTVFHGLGTTVHGPGTALHGPGTAPHGPCALGVGGGVGGDPGQPRYLPGAGTVGQVGLAGGDGLGEAFGVRLVPCLGLDQHDPAGVAGGGDLALGVADDGGRGDAVRAPGVREGHHHGPQQRLDDVHAVQVAAQFGGEVPVGVRRERGGALGHAGGEHRGLFEEFGGHAGPLGALAGEDEHGPGAAGRGALGEGAGGAAVGQRGEGAAQFGRVGSGDRGPVREAGAGGGEGPADVGRVEPGVGVEVAEERGGLTGERGGRLGGEQPRHGEALRSGAVRCGGGGRGLFEDDVGVGAADPEGRHAGPARPAVPRPVPLFGQQPHLSGVPVDLRGRLVHVQGLGKDAVAHRHDHLDDTGDTGGGLGVPEVGLDRAEPERFGAVLAVGGQQRLRLDRVAQRRPRTVRLDDVDVGGGEAGVLQGFEDDAFLGGAVGGGEAVGGAVLVDGGAADDGQHLVAVAAGVGEALHDQDADALAPHGPGRRVGEGAGAGVGGERALPAELDEGLRGGHDGDSADQGEPGLALPERLGGQVQRHQRGGAGRVDGQRRALQAEGVGDAAGDDAAGAEAADVVVVLDAGEHAGAAALEAVRVDARVLQRLPGRLQQQPLLWVHHEGFLGADTEERGVERARVVQESALADVGGVGAPPGGVDDAVHVPAPVGGERADGVGAVGDQPPQVLRGADVARVAARHAHDRQRLVRAGLGGTASTAGPGPRAAVDQGGEVGGERLR